MNKLIIIGNLTRDPELRTTSNGKQVCSLSVAVNRRRREGEEQKVDYFHVTVWNEMGANCGRYLKKGNKVAVMGMVSVSSYDGKDGKHYANLEVVAQEVEYLTPKKDQEDTKEPEEADGSVPYVRLIPVPDDEDEIPF